MKRTMLLLVAMLMVTAAPSLWAADCVQVDIELTPQVVAGEIAEGYFELTNCGDTAATVELAFDIEINGQPISLGGIPVRLGASETVSHSFKAPVPGFAVGNSISICVTATSGTAEASDCASMTVISGSPDARNFGISIALADQECVEVSLELPDTVQTGPASFADGFFELTNCGDTAALVSLEASVNFNGEDLGVGQVFHRLGAGETISRNFAIPVPPFVPEGTLTICVTATIGQSVSTSCQTIEIVSGGFPAPGGNGAIKSRNYPNPFNPETQIEFTLPESGEVTVSVYNALGQEVRRLIDHATRPAGINTVSWDGRNDSGTPVASGMYFYKVETATNTLARKMLLLK